MTPPAKKSVHVEDRVTPRLKAAAKSLSPRGLRPLWRIEETFIISAIDQNFRVGGRPTKWKPPSPITMAGRGGGTGKALQDRGDLYMAATAPGRGTSGSIRVIKGRSLTWGVNLPYAGVHNPPEGKDETVIRPKKAKMLAIPLNRQAAREESARAAWEKYDLVTVRTRKGNLLGVKRKGRGSSRAGHRTAGTGRTSRRVTLEPWFLLVPFVKIPARRFLVIPAHDVELMARAANEWLTGIFKGRRRH